VQHLYEKTPLERDEHRAGLVSERSLLSDPVEEPTNALAFCGGYELRLGMKRHHASALLVVEEVALVVDEHRGDSVRADVCQNRTNRRDLPFGVRVACIDQEEHEVCRRDLRECRFE